jgi:hypothetical protein
MLERELPHVPVAVLGFADKEPAGAFVLDRHERREVDVDAVAGNGDAAASSVKVTNASVFGEENDDCSTRDTSNSSPSACSS